MPGTKKIAILLEVVVTIPDDYDAAKTDERVRRAANSFMRGRARDIMGLRYADIESYTLGRPKWRYPNDRVTPCEPTSELRCPDKPRFPGDIVGCGSPNVSEPDDEGLCDCFDCGIWFRPHP